MRDLERIEGRRPARARARARAATPRRSRASSSSWPARSTTRACARSCAAFLDDPRFRERLRTAPASETHHDYAGGLLEHTVAVATLCREAAQLHPRLNADLLLAAALLHDVGRTETFRPGVTIAVSRRGPA